MLEMRRILLVLCLCLASVLALSRTGQRVLVVYDAKVKKEDYSTFFGGLESPFLNLVLN
jgi:hypothetical protein